MHSLPWSYIHTMKPTYNMLISVDKKPFLGFIVEILAAAAAAKLLQSCLTLCDRTDCSPPGCAVPGILQARTVEWVAFPSPKHENEKWKWSHSVMSDSSRPHGLQPTRLFHPWEFPGKSTGVVPIAFSARYLSSGQTACLYDAGLKLKVLIQRYKFFLSAFL